MRRSKAVVADSLIARRSRNKPLIFPRARYLRVTAIPEAVVSSGKISNISRISASLRGGAHEEEHARPE